MQQILEFAGVAIYVALGLTSLAIILVTERGKLFEIGEGKT